MRTTWLSLAWKEWHEHKWKLVSMVVILWGVIAISIAAEDSDRIGLACGMVFMCIVPLSLFVGLGVAANERSRDTLPFLQALPVPIWRAAIVKFAAGLLTLITTAALAAAGLYMAGRILDAAGIDYRHAAMQDLEILYSTGWPLVDFTIFCSVLAGSVYVWSAAAGVNRKDEVSAGAFALAVVVGWWALGAFLLYTLFPWHQEMWSAAQKSLYLVGLSTAPGGLNLAVDMVRRSQYEQMLLAVTTAATTSLALTSWYVWRFGRFNAESGSPKAAAVDLRTDWLNAPRSSALTAIVWKQFRESGPIALLGLAGAVAIGMLAAGHYVTSPNLFRFTTAGKEFLVGTFEASCYFCAITAMVVGIGLFLNDLKPSLNTFWRSRPIPTDLWFWVKFVSGLFIVIIVFQLPLILLYLQTGDTTPRYRNANEVLEIQGIVMLVTVAMYSAASAMICLVRQAIYAAILSIASLYLSMLAGSICMFAAAALGYAERPASFWEPSTRAHVVTGLVAGAIACTVIAWLAVRNDWGRKSRY